MHVILKLPPVMEERFSDGFGQDAEDRSIAMAIHQALVSSVRLETFPKATIDIFITVIETDGIEGCVAAGSIAASSALTHAGIEIIGLVISCSAVGNWYLLACIFADLFVCVFFFFFFFFFFFYKKRP